MSSVAPIQNLLGLDRYRCDNCGKEFSFEQLSDMSDFWSRVSSGDTIPAGDCPECGAFCYPVEPSVGEAEIVEWILEGEFDGDNIRTVGQLLEAAGRRLDKACVSDTFGSVLFKTADGRTRTLTAEGLVSEASQAYVDNLLKDEA